jgi:hypothetical protein
MLIDPYKCKVHTGKIEILSFILKFCPQCESPGAKKNMGHI